MFDISAKLSLDEQLKNKLKSKLETRLKASAELVVSSAKLIVPVRSGRLKNSIQADKVKEDGQDLSIEIGTSVEYASRVEGLEDIAGKPFLRPALYANENSITEILKGF